MIKGWTEACQQAWALVCLQFPDFVSHYKSAGVFRHPTLCTSALESQAGSILKKLRLIGSWFLPCYRLRCTLRPIFLKTHPYSSMKALNFESPKPQEP